MKQQALSEEQMVHLVRNALLVAGQEMGDGDQWPVIKDTIYKIMKDWEDLKIERNVDAELKVHLYEQLKIMEMSLDECIASVRLQLEPKVRELREVYDAYFSELDTGAIEYDVTTAPDHVKRMKAILGTLEDHHE